MSVTKISEKNKYLLWTKSAGRCQYRGCNQSLYQDILTKKNFNQAYIAHIVADEPGGPRGDAVRSKLLADDISNLMLMCDTHHRLIDKIDVLGHSEALLLAMKKEHEDRIERVANIAPGMHSHILTYRANVGAHTPELSYQSLSQYLLPEYYPAISDVIDLSLSNSLQKDQDPNFWQLELDNLQTQFNRKLLQSFSKGEIKHLSVFAFAPQPLLIKLGTLINDIYHAQVYQPIRSPKTWKLDTTGTSTVYRVTEPPAKATHVALNISLSATINDERITNTLGPDCAIYRLTIDTPFNDYLRNQQQLADFSASMRKLFNHIKVQYNEKTPLHIFPAMPVATAIELGRIWMPKADMPLHIYDQNTAKDGFYKVLEIVNA